MAAKQVGTLIATLFLARDLAHREHLKTTGAGSFARHDALGPFYEGIIGLADSLTECWQGRYEELLDIPLLAHDSDMPIRDVLRAQLDWIHDNRYEAIPREQTALHNMVDEIEALYMSTLYKLRFLS